jgi:hypothetical protein
MLVEQENHTLTFTVYSHGKVNSYEIKDLPEKKFWCFAMLDGADDVVEIMDDSKSLVFGNYAEISEYVCFLVVELIFCFREVGDSVDANFFDEECEEDEEFQEYTCLIS